MVRRSGVLGASLLIACSAGAEDSQGGASASATTDVTSSGEGGATVSTATFMGTGGAPCQSSCSNDLHGVLDCEGQVLEECTGADGCNPLTLTCANACQNAADTKQSVGCEYYAVDMELQDQGDCFAVFVANTWNTSAHLAVELGGEPLPIGNFARVPQGQGPSLTYQPFDSASGLPPGQVAILFLSGATDADVPCPVAPALPASGLAGTGLGDAVRVTADVPVVAYQMNPYGGSIAAVTGSSLLLPTSAWDTNYIAVNAAPFDILPPSMNIVATEDDTTVTILPKAPVEGGGGLPGGQANSPLTFVLDKGMYAQITQDQELSGSALDADKPIGLLAGHPCMNVPNGTSFCDHGEQMVPPVRALGSRYVAVMHRPRGTEAAFYRLVGAVDGTQLEYSADVGGPASLNFGEQALFETDQPFIVESQDDDHPFLLFTYMTGSGYALVDGIGDPELVIGVPTEQYMMSYVFFADPTYPETNLVLVRSKLGGVFHDVELDCAGTVSDWQTLGEFEWARVDLVTGDFEPVAGCSTGRREIRSEAPFGLWIWGWGTFDSNPPTANVSYGYPGGMNVSFINDVVVPVTPR